MRFSELAQFCDGTLLYVYNRLWSRLLTDQIPPTKHNDGKAKVLEAMNLIEEKLKERLMFQRVEAAMGMRSRIIGDLDEFIHLSNAPLSRQYKVELESGTTHRKSKHIDTRFHFLRDQVAKKEIVLEYCRSEDQVADILTKPLKYDAFIKMKQKMGMTNLD
ncbi:hypothetical protein OSB04_028414 [Centaurea solstitialis]|uniref:Copia protein n=1 Tax=Centaurea solstitialis TaxID=347529 RepID=A0AA38SN31_9ASTR|nr:hypothetical protein OSB04_028414 [Centaurea solstitialis]